MTRDELLARYEALGEEADFLAARELYEEALAEAPTARLLNDYGYLLECHARNELRGAAELYERAISLDPAYDKPHFQLISARAGLQEPERAVVMYEQRVEAAPSEAREYRFLANAYLRARDYRRASDAAETGLEVAPDDAALVALRGEAKAGIGDPTGALADWELALELDPEDIGPLYSIAFLHERQGQVAEAVKAWQSIVDWSEVRGYKLDSEWPRRELERLRRT